MMLNLKRQKIKSGKNKGDLEKARRKQELEQVDLENVSVRVCLHMPLPHTQLSSHRSGPQPLTGATRNSKECRVAATGESGANSEPRGLLADHKSSLEHCTQQS